MKKTMRIIALILCAVITVSVLSGCAGNGVGSTPLVVAYDPFSGKFSPFFVDSAYDLDVVKLTQIVPITTDRSGGIIYNAIEGETSAYNGTDYKYTGVADIKIERDETTDATTYTIKLRDDVKFSDGQLLDADDLIFTYYVYCDASYVGSEILSSFNIQGLQNYRTQMSDDIYLKYGLLFDAIYEGADDGTAEQKADAAAKIKQAWTDNSADAVAAYDSARNAFIAEWGVKDSDMRGGIKSISGIKKIDKNTVSVTTDGFNASAVYSVCGIQIAPMHYYGDESKYDYENGMYGFERGNLSAIEAKTSHPMGAGPYKFVKYEDKVVYFEANENYYKGTPKIKYVQFKETGEADKVSALSTGTADISNPSGSKIKFDEIRSYNSNKENSGNIVTCDTVDNLGYGYIGMNAETVSVGGNPSSSESKYLRKGLATIFSVYRDVAVDSYFGDSASVINYPISNTSWAAPQKSDADYRTAYSADINGSDIYTSDMDSNARYAAASEAAKGFFIAAGYTFDGGSGKFKAAPSGAKLEYEVLIPAGGSGDHPSMAILTNAREALGSMGITLTINDLSEPTVLWERMDAGTQEIWIAAWGAAIDPDMYQIYHSSGIIGNGGSDSNHYHISDKTLDENLLSARKSGDQSYRKSIYKACLDIINDWAVEIPTYQRQNMLVFSTERINIKTITPDITTFWGWISEIERLEMN